MVKIIKNEKLYRKDGIEHLERTLSDDYSIIWKFAKAIQLEQNLYQLQIEQMDAEDASAHKRYFDSAERITILLLFTCNIF